GAEKHCRRAMDLKRQTAASQVVIGRLLYESGDLKEAEKAFRRAVAMRPSWFLPHQVLGSLLVESRRCEEGMASLTRASELMPGNFSIESEITAAHVRQGNREAAIQRARLLATRFPEQANAHVLLGQVLAFQGKREAEKVARAGMNRFPGDARFLVI